MRQQDHKRASSAESAKTASQHTSGVKGKQATQEQIRLAELTLGEPKTADIQRLIQQVVDLTGKSEDEASVALHDCNFDTETAVQHLFEEAHGVGEWTTCRSRKTRTTPATGNSHFGSGFEHGRGRRGGRGGRGAGEGGGFGDFGGRGGFRGRGDDDRPFRSRGGSRGRSSFSGPASGGRGFSRNNGRSRTGEWNGQNAQASSTSSWGKSSSGDDYGKSSGDDWGQTPASTDLGTLSAGWGLDPPAGTVDSSWGLAKENSLVTDDSPPDPAMAEWGTGQTAKAAGMGTWTEEEVDGSIVSDTQAPVLNGDVCEPTEEELAEEISRVTVREGCLIGEATANEPHHQLFPGTVPPQACQIRRSQIPLVPVEMPRSACQQTANDLGIVFGVPPSPEPQPLAQSPVEVYSQERHEYVGDVTRPVTSDSSEMLSLASGSQNMLLHQQSPMTSAHMSLGSVVPMSSSHNSSNSSQEASVLDRHLPIGNDLSQGAGAAEASPGSVPSHHSTPGTTGLSSMMDMVAAAAANTAAEPVMHSPLAAQQTVVSGRLLESSGTGSSTLENSPKPQLSPAAATMGVGSSPGSSHASPVVGVTRGPPPLAMPPGAAATTTVTTSPPGIGTSASAVSTSATGQRTNSHKGGAPPGMLMPSPPYMPSYLPMMNPYADFDSVQQRGLSVGRDGTGAAYQGADSKFQLDPSSSTSAIGQGAPGMSLYAAQAAQAAQAAHAMYYNQLFSSGFMIPPHMPPYIYGQYPHLQSKGHFGPGGAYLAGAYGSGLTANYEEDYGKNYQSSGSQGQGKGSSTSVSYASSSGSGLAGSGYPKGQYDASKSSYQGNSSAGLFGMQPGAPSSQSGAGLTSYALPSGHGQVLMPPNLGPPHAGGVGQPMHSHQGSGFHHMLDNNVANAHMTSGPSQSSRSSSVSQHMHSGQSGKHHQLGGKQNFGSWQG